MVEQGEILKLEGIKHEALVVSKDRYNESGNIIVCGIADKPVNPAICFPISEDKYAICDDMRKLDLRCREFSVKGRVSLAHMIQIIDRLQSLFDYI